MQMIGSVTFYAACVTVVTGLSVSLYAALPRTLLDYAERHGRFQGLRVQETLVRGTRDQPPLGTQLALAE